MLESVPLSPNIVTTDLKRAREFYVETLGLSLTEELPGAMFVDAGGTPVFVYERDTPAESDATLASWTVKDIRAVVRDLVDKGITFERYPGLEQDEDAIASRGMTGPWAAWFKDPDGNVLGLTQDPTD